MLSFDTLKAEYEQLWNSMKVRPDKVAAVDAIARKLLANKARYQRVALVTKMPWFVIAAWHNRESDADFDTQLAQGDPLDSVSVNEPTGRGPFGSWEEGAYDALITLKDLGHVGEWTPARICYETERYNGFGYRNYHPNVKSPYLWSFTTHYTSGKYVGDGEFLGTAVDKQCGAIPVMKSLMALESPAKPIPPESTSWVATLVSAVLAIIRGWAKSAEPTDLASRLIRAMRKRGFKVDDVPGNPIVLYVEGMNPDGTVNDNRPNEFNDTRFVLSFDQAGRPGIIGAWEGTTEPSKRWTVDPMNSKGAARTKFGQYTAWQLGDHHGHEALVQTGGEVTVCRDANKDYKRDGDEEDTGYFGINQHAGYDLPKGDLGASSAGCLVGRTFAGHRQFMSLMKADGRFKANNKFVFTAAVIPASEVV